jgi:glycosyltransferase involved in cell wall biosynthesis
VLLASKINSPIMPSSDAFSSAPLAQCHSEGMAFAAELAEVPLEVRTSHPARAPHSSNGSNAAMPRVAEPRVMFLYWGRRGLSEFTLLLAEAARQRPDRHAVFCVSRQNERFADFAHFGPQIEAIDTFRHNTGALFAAWRVRRLRQSIRARIARDRIDTVVSLMPHVWSPLVSPAIRAMGVRFVSLIHDAMPHPGDVASHVAAWTGQDLYSSDLVITLSEHVTRSLTAGGLLSGRAVRTLFHPHLRFASTSRPGWPAVGEPFRVLFLGRILPYKGLGLLLDAVEVLRRQGLPIELGVYGDGALGDAAPRLEAIGAEIENRWLAADEIPAILSRYHAVVLSHTEASQSGIAALAAGHGVPVVANPVGGIVEQVTDGRTGIIASAISADALAEAIGRLARNASLYHAIESGLATGLESRSMATFLSEIYACLAEMQPADGMPFAKSA